MSLDTTRLKVYDTGIWCKSCGWYEEASNITQNSETCTGCGCAKSEHRAAHVVRA